MCLILGLKPKDKVAFFPKDEGVLLIKPAAVDLAAGFKSISALKSARPSDEMTEIDLKPAARSTAAGFIRRSHDGSGRSFARKVEWADLMQSL